MSADTPLLNKVLTHGACAIPFNGGMAVAVTESQLAALVDAEAAAAIERMQKALPRYSLSREGFGLFRSQAGKWVRFKDLEALASTTNKEGS